MEEPVRYRRENKGVCIVNQMVFYCISRKAKKKKITYCIIFKYTCTQKSASRKQEPDFKLSTAEEERAMFLAEPNSNSIP